MTMGALLVPVEQSDVLASMLECAHLVAQRFNSHIEGLHVRPVMAGIVAADGLSAATMVASFEQEDRESGRRAKQLFTDFMAAREVPWAVDMPAQRGISAGWLEEVSAGGDVVGHHGRRFDLIVVGRPVQRAINPGMSTLESALFESGRPILVAPPSVPSQLGETIVIAWNGSNESARSIAFAMPFLEQAKAVTVLSVESGMVPGPSGADMQQYLARNGIAAGVVDVPTGSRSTGEAILEEAKRLGCDLLVKGAYTHSRLRQMIFGGATSHILAHAELPVFMAN